MTVSEKVAYLKGLSEGLALDDATKEGKLILAIIDTLGEVADKLDELDENATDICDEIDAISEDLSDVEDAVFGEDDYDDDDCHCDCCGHEDEDDDEPALYEVKCPACGNEITVDEDVLDLGSIECPKCGEKLEFEFEDEEDEEK